MQVLLILLTLYCSRGAAAGTQRNNAGAASIAASATAAISGHLGYLEGPFPGTAVNRHGRRKNKSAGRQALNHIYKDLVSIIITQSSDKARRSRERGGKPGERKREDYF